MPVNLQAYSDAYHEDVAVLLREHGWEERYVAGQVDALAHLASASDGIALVALEDGRLAGFVSLEIHSWNGLAQLRGLGVARARLRRGIGTLLIEAVEQIARDRTCRGIYVDTPVDNERGRAFYDARGFTEDYRMTRYYSDELDGVTYVKFFPAP